ncbi:MAG TPA: hypothetical protein VNV38_08275 [Stellaceae bacterium]|jgi:hypothetical protein|nr:hypothetical protein [Stellaceae bacterium]
MLRFFSDIFNSSDLSPHGICLLWRPELIWLHVTSDAIIALSYYSIPLALTYFVLKRRDVVFGWLFWMFGAFILACGTTHVFGILTLWYPVYGIEGAVKFVTAIVSIFTAVVLWPLLPRALALPSPAMLTRANEELSAEIDERNKLWQRCARARNATGPSPRHCSRRPRRGGELRMPCGSRKKWKLSGN